MSADPIDRAERTKRRVALLNETGIDLLRGNYEKAASMGLDRPIACIFHVSAGGGYNALKALGSNADCGSWVLPFEDVMQVATKCSMFELVDTLKNRLHLGEFVVLCLAWDGWSLFYPDRPGGLDPKPWEKPSEPGPPADPKAN